MSSNFLWNSGPGNSGLLVPAVTLLNGASASEELFGLASGAFAASEMSGVGGVFNNSNFGSGIWAEIFLELDAIGSALQAGACVAGWFLPSFDSGTTFEQSAAQPPRAPDFLIPLPATTIDAGTVFKAQGMVMVEPLIFKVGILNSTGQPLAASSDNFLRIAPVAQAY